MAEQTFHPGNNKPGNTKSTSAELKSVQDQALDAGRQLKDKAAQYAETSSEQLKEKATEFTAMAKDAASQAADRLKETVGEQRGAGAEYVGNLAETIRRAAREFDNDLPIAGKYIRKAADQVENVSDSIRTGDFNQLIGSAQSFARRQPTAFLGLAMLAGFAAVRFIKSSSDAAGPSINSQRREHDRGQSHGFQN